MSEAKENKALIMLLVSVPLIQGLYMLHPDYMFYGLEAPTYKLFPYSEVPISKPTYFYFALRHTVWLIVISYLWVTNERYKYVFAFWFWIQAAQFVEYFFNYNEAQLWFYIHGFRLDVDLTLLKMAGLPIMFLVYDYIWVRK